MSSLEIYGYLPLYKQRGSYSNQEIQFLKKRLGIKKIGHSGTLDPIADGVLPVMVNRATRTMKFFLEYEKTYLFTIQFGISTDTLDISGKVIKQSDRTVEREELIRVLSDFTGYRRQKTPQFSARKYKGRSLYYYARKGISVPASEKEIRIDEIRLVDFSFPFAQIEVRCSSGTYIRQLTDDICNSLNVAGTVYSLTRTSYGRFNIHNSKIKDAITLDDLVSISDVFYDFGRFEILDNALIRAKNGATLLLGDIKGIIGPDSKRFFGIYKGDIIGIYSKKEGEFYPEVILIGQV